MPHNARSPAVHAGTLFDIVNQALRRQGYSAAGGSAMGARSFGTDP